MEGEKELGVIVNDMKYRFVHQYKFARRLKRQFLSDYAALDFGILLEYDGLQTYDYELEEETKSGHQTNKGIINDHEKHNLSTLMGFYTLRYNRDTLCEDTVVENIDTLVIRRKEDVKHTKHCRQCNMRIWVPLSMVTDLGNDTYLCLECQWLLDEAVAEQKRAKRCKRQ